MEKLNIEEENRLNNIKKQKKQLENDQGIIKILVTIIILTINFILVYDLLTGDGAMDFIQLLWDKILG